jgi:3-oxoadipate enol-lactonase
VVDQGYVDSGGARLFYQTSGTGQALVFIHAGVADSRMWRLQFEGLADTNRIVAFDQRGFGKTPWIPGPYADRRDVIAVMDQLEVNSAVIVGCSLGGSIALHVALDHPDRVDGLILVGAAANGWEPANGWGDSLLWDQVLAAAKAGDVDKAVELDAEMWVVGTGRTRADVDPDIYDLVMAMDRIPLSSENERNEQVEPYNPPTNESLDQIKAPTLVIVGAHDEIDLIESAHYLAERLSSQQAVVIPGAAHLPSLEQPEAFNAAIRRFLESL